MTSVLHFFEGYHPEGIRDVLDRVERSSNDVELGVLNSYQSDGLPRSRDESSYIRQRLGSRMNRRSPNFSPAERSRNNNDDTLSNRLVGLVALLRNLLDERRRFHWTIIINCLTLLLIVVCFFSDQSFLRSTIIDLTHPKFDQQSNALVSLNVSLKLDIATNKIDHLNKSQESQNVQLGLLSVAVQNLTESNRDLQNSIHDLVTLDDMKNFEQSIIAQFRDVIRNFTRSNDFTPTRMNRSSIVVDVP